MTARSQSFSEFGLIRTEPANHDSRDHLTPSVRDHVPVYLLAAAEGLFLWDGSGYGAAWIGHFFIERTDPQHSGIPISFMAITR